MANPEGADLQERTELILGVVRGDRPLTDLRNAGVLFHIKDAETGDRWIEVRLSDAAAFSVTPSISDLASGLRTYQHRPQILRDWGSLIMAADFLDLERLELEPQGEMILDALWAASFEGKVADPAALDGL